MKHVDLATAAEIAGVKPCTIRQWVRRQIITRHRDGYDVYELLHWIDVQRNQEMAALAVAPRKSSRQPTED